MHHRLPLLLPVFAALSCAGCASSESAPEKPISMSIDVWDCRGEHPRRITQDDKDPLYPHVSSLVFPQNGKGLNDIFDKEPDAQKQ